MSEAPNDVATRLAELEARVAALSSMIKSMMTAFMIHGLLTKAEIGPLIAEAEMLMRKGAASDAGKQELAKLEADLPAYMRERLGPAPDPDDHGH